LLCRAAELVLSLKFVASLVSYQFSKSVGPPDLTSCDKISSEVDPLQARSPAAPEISSYSFSKHKQQNEEVTYYAPSYYYRDSEEEEEEKVTPDASSTSSALSSIVAIFTAVVFFAFVIIALTGKMRNVGETLTSPQKSQLDTVQVQQLTAELQAVGSAQT
jgi:hypothetical protein